MKNRERGKQNDRQGKKSFPLRIFVEKYIHTHFSIFSYNRKESLPGIILQV